MIRTKRYEIVLALNQAMCKCYNKYNDLQVLLVTTIYMEDPGHFYYEQTLITNSEGYAKIDDKFCKEFSSISVVLG